MMRRLLLLLLVPAGLCAQLHFSKPFPTPPKSKPLALLNTEGPFFYFLRYNRLAHDVTVEKRRKDDGMIAGFAALRMDSINASWFDYDQLDHLVIAAEDRLYYVFERVLNKQRKLYMKEIDTLCRTGGFVELASLETDKKETGLDLDFTLTSGKKLLVVKSRTYGSVVYKTAELIDPASRRVLFRYRLPVENRATGYSGDFVTDGSGRLYYTLYRYQTGFYFAPQLVPGAAGDIRRQVVDSVFAVGLDTAGNFVRQCNIPIDGCEYVHAMFCEADPDGLKLNFLYTFQDSAGKRQLATGWAGTDPSMNLTGYASQPLPPRVQEQLTFYDGLTDNSPGAKLYTSAGQVSADGSDFFIAERLLPNTYKELIVWSKERGTDARTSVCLLPRKTFYFHNRVPYNSFGLAMFTLRTDTLVGLLLEHQANRHITPDRFTSRRYSRLETERKAVLSAYLCAPDGHTRKKVIWQNSEYSCIPVHYQGAQRDVVFYFVRGERERFGVLKAE